MKIFNSIKLLQKKIIEKKYQKKSIGFVPTMGALHAGHLSLIQKARRENDIAVLSIFVNPTQFGKGEDLSSYPRQEKKDILLAKKEKVDILFLPTEKMMYPFGYLTYVQVGEMGDILCGASRPDHFQGVTTIVTKLLNIVTPNRLYLGQKDAQQALIIQKMINDLNLNVNVKICPTVREADGLALSSRNSYLTQQQREEAPVLLKSLKKAKQAVLSGTNNATKIKQMIQTTITDNSSGIIDYVECVDAETLRSLKMIQGKVLIALAVKFGKTRLIDNIIFKTV